MKRSATYTLRIAIALMAVGLASRLLWLAGSMETGLEGLRLQWRDAAWGWVVGNRVPVQFQEPRDQARLWLREVDRILADHPDDAQLAMGAALVLDSPSLEFEVRHLDPGSFPFLDRDEIARAIDEFEALCRDKCLELAAKATELEPANVDCWRLRALLEWRYSIHGRSTPPATDRREFLEQCVSHDSENALYDYLTTYHEWSSSLSMAVSDDRFPLIVKDQAQFDRGLNHFDRAQQKPYLAIGDAGYTATARFLQQSTVPLIDQEKLVNGRLSRVRGSILLGNIYRWQHLRAHGTDSAGDPRAAVDMHRQNLRLIRQFSQDPSTQFSDLAFTFRIKSTSEMTA